MSDPGERALKLMRAKDAIEAELSALTEELNSPGAEGAPPAGITGSLEDDEGVPRADLDIYDVRQKRHRVSCLQTDHKRIMASIEEALANSGESAKATSSSTKKETEAGTESMFDVISQSKPALVPMGTTVFKTEQMLADAFALVNEVAAGGPAEEAGLLVNDLLVKVGDIDHQNHRNLAAVGQLIQSSEGRAVPIVVLRQPSESLALSNYQSFELSLTPQAWSGRGLLGCHLLPR
jgi:26S proteasome non-ATPase regulatory subunit 9